jgi:8-oxo-dGTP pyrophosphatase MutT (NUDIX family)
MADQQIRDAASVILVRHRNDAEGLEVFLLRRHRKASFMSSAFVFPGGTADPGETDPRYTAARELFEEAGVLLADREVAADTRDVWRSQLHEAERPFDEMLADVGASIDLGALGYFAHWITPSIEKKRFSAKFFFAELPPGQTPSFDNKETVDEIWVTPTEALERAGELKLPPPQVRTFIELRDAALAGISALRTASDDRVANALPILPRLRTLDTGGFALLLPWDPEYASHGSGDSHEMPSGHPLGVGPSRFILEDMTWKNVFAPSSPNAD